MSKSILLCLALETVLIMLDLDDIYSGDLVYAIGGCYVLTTWD
jgi:hypothetical protein